MVDKQRVRHPDGTRRTALITGSGIGRELCRCFHAAGFDVVGVLVNNARFGLAGRFVDQPLSRLSELLALNLIPNPVILTVVHGFMKRYRRLSG